MQNKSFDSMDLILCMALWVGGYSGNWIPAILLFAIYTIGIKAEKEEIKSNESKQV